MPQAVLPRFSRHFQYFCVAFAMLLRAFLIKRHPTRAIPIPKKGETKAPTAPVRFQILFRPRQRESQN